jgi:hypothetical protein
MRRLIMWNMVTLDGFFEGPKSWEIDWHEYLGRRVGAAFQGAIEVR